MIYRATERRLAFAQNSPIGEWIFSFSSIWYFWLASANWYFVQSSIVSQLQFLQIHDLKYRPQHFIFDFDPNINSFFPYFDLFVTLVSQKSVFLDFEFNPK